MSSFAKKLEAALDSRQHRAILRRLPAPSSADGKLVDFNSNDYLSFASSPQLRQRFIQKLSASPQILGSTGSRLLINPAVHDALEKRLCRFFQCQSALLFNSGFDANVAFFSSVPQPGDFVVYDEYIHASVHDGLRASRLPSTNIRQFLHNSVPKFRQALLHLRSAHKSLGTGDSSVFVSVESLYSMDGTFSPLEEMVATMGEIFPEGNAHLVVDEAHATGIYGPLGRGRVALLGLEDKVLARLCTFGKALGASGAALLTSALVRDYLLNYGRSLIYTTSLSCANIIAVDCSFDLLQNGTADKLSGFLLSLTSDFVSTLISELTSFRIKHSIIHLPSLDLSPIVPIHTPYPLSLSQHLRSLGLIALPIRYPTVPKGMERVRVCMHAGNTPQDVRRLVGGIMEWAREKMEKAAVESESQKQEMTAKL